MFVFIIFTFIVTLCESALDVDVYHPHKLNTDGDWNLQIRYYSNLSMGSSGPSTTEKQFVRGGRELGSGQLGAILIDLKRQGYECQGDDYAITCQNLPSEFDTLKSECWINHGYEPTYCTDTEFYARQYEYTFGFLYVKQGNSLVRKDFRKNHLNDQQIHSFIKDLEWYGHECVDNTNGNVISCVDDSLKYKHVKGECWFTFVKTDPSQCRVNKFY